MKKESYSVECLFGYHAHQLSDTPAYNVCNGCCGRMNYVFEKKRYARFVVEVFGTRDQSIWGRVGSPQCATFRAEARVHEIGQFANLSGWRKIVRLPSSDESSKCGKPKDTPYFGKPDYTIIIS